MVLPVILRQAVAILQVRQVRRVLQEVVTRREHVLIVEARGIGRSLMNMLPALPWRLIIIPEAPVAMFVAGTRIIIIIVVLPASVDS